MAPIRVHDVSASVPNELLAVVKWDNFIAFHRKNIFVVVGDVFIR